MFRLALAFVLGLTYSGSTNAQEQKYLYSRQECDPFQVVLEVIEGKYGEKPLFVGAGVQFGIQGNTYTGGAMFFVNQTTGTWSLVHLYADGTACVSAVGTNFEPFTGPTEKLGEKM